MKYNWFISFFNVNYLCLAYKPDILCMQEVESKMFNRELSPLLKQYMNMCGVYLRKSGRRHEGLSCFYSCDKFK